MNLFFSPEKSNNVKTHFAIKCTTSVIPNFSAKQIGLSTSVTVDHSILPLAECVVGVPCSCIGWIDQGSFIFSRTFMMRLLTSCYGIRQTRDVLCALQNYAVAYLHTTGVAQALLNSTFLVLYSFPSFPPLSPCSFFSLNYLPYNQSAR